MKDEATVARSVLHLMPSTVWLYVTNFKLQLSFLWLGLAILYTYVHNNEDDIIFCEHLYDLKVSCIIV